MEALLDLLMLLGWPKLPDEDPTCSTPVEPVLPNAMEANSIRPQPEPSSLELLSRRKQWQALSRARLVEFEHSVEWATAPR